MIFGIFSAITIEARNEKLQGRVYVLAIFIDTTSRELTRRELLIIKDKLAAGQGSAIVRFDQVTLCKEGVSFDAWAISTQSRCRFCRHRRKVSQL